jgi:ornithine carbamoyltransferase
VKKKNKRDFLELSDIRIEEFEQIWKLTSDLKKRPIRNTLKNKVIGMIFSKSSTRTRVSFEVGIAQLGGRSLFLSPQDIQLGRGESIPDTARVLSRYLDAIIIRTYAHEDIQRFAQHANIPIINGLTDLAHPIQVLSDLFTIREKLGAIKNKKIVYLGDCKNNMAYSWVLGAALLGCHFVLSGHPEYMPSSEVFSLAKNLSKKSGAKIEWMRDPQAAVENADVLYTDVWTSMGQEAEFKKRKKDLHPWQINDTLLKKAKKTAIFMHCLPAHRGEEVTEEVLEGPQSIVFDQAENRLHVQKAILLKVVK